MADSTLSNLTSLTLPSQATDLLLVGRGTARPNKVAMSDALNSAALAATTAAYGVVLLAPDGGTTAGTVVQANDSRLTGGGGGVTSLAGTANQITASAATGAVTLSLPSTLILPGTLTVNTSGAFIGDGGTAVASRQLTVRSVNGAAFRTVASFVNDITGAGAFTAIELLSDGVTGTLASYGPTYGTAAYANSITLANGAANGLVNLSAHGAGGSIRFIQQSFGNEIARFAPTTGNLLIGLTADLAGSRLRALGATQRVFNVGSVAVGADTAVLLSSTNEAASGYTPLALNGSVIALNTHGANVLIGGTTDIAGTGGLKVFGTTNSTSAITGALIVGNGTNGGIGVSGYSYFAEQVNGKSFEALGTPSYYSTNGGISMAGNAGSAYAAIKAYSNSSGTEKTISLNPGNQAGVAIGTVGPAAAGSLLTTGNVITTDVKLNTTELSLRSVAADRAVRQELAFDGTKGVTCSTPILSGDWTVAFVVNRQSSAVQQYLIGNDVNGCFYLGFRTAGFLYSGKALGSPNADMSLGNVVGVTQHIVVTKSGTTQTCYADGVSVGSITDSQTYTAAAATLFAADSAGSAALIGNGALIGFYNRALSAAEVARLFRDGTPAASDQPVQIAGTALLTGNNSNFATGVGTWQQVNGAAISASGGVLNVTGSSGFVGAGTENGLVRRGNKYRLQFTAANYTGTIANVMVFTNDGTTYGSFPAGTSTVEFTASVTSYVGFSASSGTSGTFTLDDVTLIPLGVTLSPDAAQPGSGFAWYDTSGLGRTITLPNTGVSWSVATGGYNPQISTVNSSMGFLAQNKSTGNAAVAAIDLQNENGSAYGFGLRYFGNSFTQVNAYRSNRGVLYGAFDINFLSGQYKFWFGGAGAALDNSTAYEGFNIYGPSLNTGTVSVYFTTPSSAFGTGALTVAGGASFGGALFSQQNSNAIVTGTNFANTNAGTAATLRHTLTAGTNNSTIEAYSNGHATFPGRLRFGTNNGQMDFVPSGVLGLSISATGVTAPNPLTVTGTTTVDSLPTSGFFGGSKRAVIGYDTTNDYGFVASVDTGVGWKQLRLNPYGGRVLVPGTDASTGVSSGALVIGNGTSGGLGVSGAIFAGGDIHSVGTNASLTMWKDATPTKAAQMMFNALGDNGVAIRIYNGTAWSAAVNVGPTGTLTANAASDAFRITNAQTPASQTAAGTAGQITWDTSYIYVCTATNSWGRSSLNWSGGGGGGLSPWAVKTANYTAVNGDRLLADTSAGAFTITLPASPSAGDYIEINDPEETWPSFNLTVGRNSSKIDSLAEDLVCNITSKLGLTYIDATIGWKVDFIAELGGGTNGTKTYAYLTPLVNQPPASNFATLDTRNSIATLDFDDGATNESANFVAVLPEAAVVSSGLKVRIHWMATSATSGNCRWGVQFADLSDQDIDSYAYDTATETSTATSGTSGNVTVTEITATAIDSISAGKPYALKVYRDSSDTTNDTMTGDAELVAVEVRSAT